MNTHHKGWYSRGYLPHFDRPHRIQGLTFRLADSLPFHIVDALAQDPEIHNDTQRRTRIETHLNTGYGACYLREPHIGQLVEDALLHFDKERYQLIAWVVMPNHVHGLIETIEGYPLGGIVHSWKSFTANEANRRLRRQGAFWFPDYFDRYIRNQQHLENAIRYIHNNPVKAGLVDRPEAWPFSSARLWEP